MKCSRLRKRERGRSLSRAGLRQENPRDNQAYHTEMILPSTKIIFHDDLQLFASAPMYSAATSRELTASDALRLLFLLFSLPAGSGPICGLALEGKSK